MNSVPSASDAGPTHTLRPNLLRQDTDRILSYYQSSHAGQAYSPPASEDRGNGSGPRRMRTRQMSSGSTSPSDYSSDYDEDNEKELLETNGKEGLASSGAQHHRRRSSVLSEGSADKRRLAVIQLDSESPSLHEEHTSGRAGHAASRMPSSFSASSSGLLSRRGLNTHLRGLALVAPPDASPNMYTDLTPPTSAPVEGTKPSIDTSTNGTSRPSMGHKRSASEIPKSVKSTTLRHKSSRDVGIVGTSPVAYGHGRPHSHQSPRNHTQVVEPNGNGNPGLQPPIFQTPKSRSPSPNVSSSSDHSHQGANALRESQTQDHSLLTTTHPQPILTPSIGQEKHVEDPVAGPVVMDLSSRVRGATSVPNIMGLTGIPNPQLLPQLSNPAEPYVPLDLSSYLLYEPGVHSTAGPLPPPPRAIFKIDASSPPPPRPPRLHSPPPINPRRRPDTDAVKQPLQLPQSGLAPPTANLSRVSLHRGHSDYSIMAVSVHSDDDDKSGPSPESAPDDRSNPVHIREGAFPPSRFISSPPVPDRHSVEGARPEPISEDGHAFSNDPPPTMMIEPPKDEQRTPAREISGDLELRRESSWVSLGHEFAHLQVSSLGATSATSSSPSPIDISTPKVIQDTETQPEGAADKFVKIALTNLKRFSSLPRTPSGASVDRSSVGSQRTTPSPSNLPTPQSVPRPKIRSKWPDAMHYGDVLSKRSALERSVEYARKINELAVHDCGLGAWVMATRNRGSSGSRMDLSSSGPVRPSTRSFTAQLRHTSHGSQASEATFPRRPDAFLATDLSVRPSDDMSLPTGPPPTLPYPSLAQSPGIVPMRLSTIPSSPASVRSSQMPIAVLKASSGGGGFFASIGRKTSTKKERFGPGSPPSGRLLTKAAPNVAPAPRPVQIQSPPLVPGGPRAPAGRIQRSYTMSPGSPAESSQSPPTSVSRRQSITAKRPSFFGGSRSSASQVPDTEFIRQVDKLADLLPHADKDILAGYLRRAGQDIVAIGQYLEDEKRGTIRHD